MMAPKIKKIKYVRLRPSLSDEVAQANRPKILNSEIKPTNPAPTAAAAAVIASSFLISAKPTPT